MIAGTIPCPRCRFVSIPLDGRLMCHGCTRDMARTVPGEEELLYQRWCDRCMSYWPFTSEFWYLVRWEAGDPYTHGGTTYVRKSSGASVRCLSCKREAA